MSRTIGHVGHLGLSVTLLAALCLSGCGETDGREDPIADEVLWEDPGTEVEVSEPVQFVNRASGGAYGLPAAGQPGLSTLLDVMDAQPTGFDVSDLYVAPGITAATDQCRGGGPTEISELPLTVDVVVTIHPRKYMKPQICGQDERHYGNFTVADDTGGIIVLRDSRVAPYTFGDRLRMTIRGAGRTFSADIDTRAIVIADIEKLPSEEKAIVYTDQTTPFGVSDVGQVRRVEGWVEQAPTNNNFNTIVLAAAPVERRQPPSELTGSLLQCVRTCEGPAGCPATCPRTDDTDLCASICVSGCLNALEATPGRNVQELIADVIASVPACWVVSLDVELGRRGYALPQGSRVGVTGPVVNDFDRKIWVGSSGQIERLE